MGMFDTFIVDHEIIEDLIPEDLRLPLKQRNDKIDYHFQSKDFDCSLDTYFLKKDKKLYAQKYKWREDGQGQENKIEFEKYTGYVNFYTFETDINREDIWISFDAHIILGELIDLKLDSIERDSAEERELAHKLNREIWDKRQKTIQWKLFELLNGFELKIKKLIYPISNTYQNLKEYFRESAVNKYPNPKD